MPRTIKTSEFQAKCLALVDEVARTGERVVITKNCKPIAELRPHQAARPNALGCLKDSLFITGDIISPIDVDWNATTHSDRGGSRRERPRRKSSARPTP